MTYVTVVGARTTVYGRAHELTRVLLTSRVQRLLDSGVLHTVEYGGREPNVADEVDTVETGETRKTRETRLELLDRARAMGIDVRPSWSKSRLRDEIAKRLEIQASQSPFQPPTPADPIVDIGETALAMPEEVVNDDSAD